VSSFDLQDALEMAEDWAQEFYPDDSVERAAFVDGCIEALATVWASILEREVRGE
jgi:hypothetical protein